MLRTIKAVIHPDGAVRLLEPVHLGSPQRAFVTILEDGDEVSPSIEALLSEAALAIDWCRPEEDAAWRFLQGAR